MRRIIIEQCYLAYTAGDFYLSSYGFQYALAQDYQPALLYIDLNMI